MRPGSPHASFAGRCNIRLDLVAVPLADEIKTVEPDPVLLKLSAHAFTTQYLLARKIKSPLIANNGDQNARQLMRMSYLASDIISTITNGSNPVNLNDHELLGMGNPLLSLAEQRDTLGFETAKKLQR